MIVYVIFVHKKSVSKRKVCIIFIKNLKFKKPKKNNNKKTFYWIFGFFVVFWGGFFGWVFYFQPWLKAEREKYEDEVDYCNQIIENLKAKNSESLLMAENTRFVTGYTLGIFCYYCIVSSEALKTFLCQTLFRGCFLGSKDTKVGSLAKSAWSAGQRRFHGNYVILQKEDPFFKMSNRRELENISQR
jgi:hypothetical protein